MATYLGLVAIVACVAALLAIFSGERIVPEQPIHRLGRRFICAQPLSFSTGGAATVRPAFPTNF